MGHMPVYHCTEDFPMEAPTDYVDDDASMSSCIRFSPSRHRFTSSLDAQHALTLKTETCVTTRGPHGLFDYEAKDTIARFFHMCRSFNIVRNEMDVHTVMDVHDESGCEDKAEVLAQVICRDQKYFVQWPISHPSEESPSSSSGSKLWRVVKNGHMAKLKEGDVMKLGGFNLKVRHLVAPKGNGSRGSSSVAIKSPFPMTYCSRVTIDEDTTDKCCRICLMTNSCEEDPLIRPCSCRGSIELIHLKCLRYWITDKLGLRHDANNKMQARSFYYRPLACELCKTEYKSHVRNDDENHVNATPTAIVELPTTFAPYVVLEREAEHGAHVLCLADKSFLKLGRGHESDIRFPDGSVSRWHATLHYSAADKRFRIEDHSSKFGTLLGTRSPICVDKPVVLQAGRTVLHFEPPQSTPRD